MAKFELKYPANQGLKLWVISYNVLPKMIFELKYPANQGLKQKSYSGDGQELWKFELKYPANQGLKHTGRNENRQERTIWIKISSKSRIETPVRRRQCALSLSFELKYPANQGLKQNICEIRG